MGRELYSRVTPSFNFIFLSNSLLSFPVLVASVIIVLFVSRACFSFP